jgi:ribose 5-phosphate isomerase A
LDRAKRAAAFAAAADHVHSGQTIGVGSGTTCRFLVECLGERYRSGQLKEIVCVPTSFLVSSDFTFRGCN